MPVKAIKQASHPMKKHADDIQLPAKENVSVGTDIRSVCQSGRRQSFLTEFHSSATKFCHEHHHYEIQIILNREIFNNFCRLGHRANLRPLLYQLSVHYMTL
jgi:hypothetical protein